MSTERQNKAFIFIDEFGTPALNVDSPGVEPYFIYVAVLIESENLEKERETLQSVRDKYNQGSPLKANKIPNNDKGHSKRLNVHIGNREDAYKNALSNPPQRERLGRH